MLRRSVVLLCAGLLAGCSSGSAPRGAERLLAVLQDDSRDRRDRAFQELLRGEGVPAARLRLLLEIAPEHGYPVAALLYAQGRGDAVPLDLQARHLAGFEWPRDRASENAIVEPHVRGEIERDLLRTGRPALRVLGRALEETAASEAAALRVVRALLRIGGRGAAVEFARLLDCDRDLGGPRVCDAAAAALLYLGNQELPLRIAVPDERVAAARSWWELAKDFPESEWVREAVEALAAKDLPGDPAAVHSVLERLAGQPIGDGRDWWARNRDWRPAVPPLRPEELLPALALDPPRAFDANRRLEEATGVRVFLPRMERVSELAAALRLGRPPADLALRWGRQLRSPLLRLSMVAIGPGPRSGPLRIRWATEAHFHPTEGESGDLRIETQTESYSLYVQSLDLGTRLVASESHGAGGLWSGVLRESREGRPLLMFSAPLKAAIVAVVEEVPSRRSPPPVPELRSEWRERLRAWADSADALRALGYFQDAADRRLLRERRAGAGLLLLGDPAGLELQPSLEPHEIEMALRVAEDPRVRTYLEALRTAPRP